MIPDPLESGYSGEALIRAAAGVVDHLADQARAYSRIGHDRGAVGRAFRVKPGLVADGRTLTYQDLNGRCNRVAGGLQGLGAQLGDRVSMYSPNRWEWLVAYRAALRIGAVVNHQRGADAGRSGLVLNDCGGTVIFTADEKAGQLCLRPATTP